MMKIAGTVDQCNTSGGKSKGNYLQIRFRAKVGWVQIETQLISFLFPDAENTFANKFPGNPDGLSPEFNGIEGKQFTLLIHI